MNLVEKIDYSHDLLTGDKTVRHRMKPDASVQGKISLQLHDATSGDLVQEVTSHNIAMDHVARSGAILNVLYGLSNVKSTSSSLNFASVYGNYTSLTLTDWDKEECPNTPIICGKTVGTGTLTGKTTSLSDLLRGAHNVLESSVDFTDEGKLRARMVFDWPTTHANGTIKSVWLHGYVPYMGNLGQQQNNPAFYPGLKFSGIQTTVNEDYTYYFKRKSEGDTSVNTKQMILIFDTQTRKYLNSVTLDEISPDYATAFKLADGGWLVMTYGSIPIFYTFDSTGRLTNTINNVTTLITQAQTPDGTKFAYVTDQINGSGMCYLQDINRVMISAYQYINGQYKSYILFMDPTTGEIDLTRDITSFINRYVSEADQFKCTAYINSGRYSDGKVMDLVICRGANTSTVVTLTVFRTEDNQLHFLGDSEQARPSKTHCGKLCFTDGISPSSDGGYAVVAGYKFTPLVGTHTLLPAPVVKENTHTLKVIYEVVVDLIRCVDPTTFYEKMEQVFTSV